MLRSIRWRLAASYALIVLLSVTLMGALALYIVQRYVGQQESESLRRNAEEVAGQALPFFGPQLRRIALQELAATAAFLGDARVRIEDADKAVIADSGDPGLPDEFLWLIPSPLQELREEIDPRKGAGFPLIFPLLSTTRAQETSPTFLPLMRILPLLRDLPLGTSHTFARRMLTPWGRSFMFEGSVPADSPGPAGAALPRQFVVRTVPVGAADAPAGWVEISGPLSLSGAALQPMRDAVLLSGLGSLLIALTVGFLFGRSITDPLRSLALTARRMGDGDLAARAVSTRKDEIGELARQFNGMAQNLETSFSSLRADRDSLKRFIADASHELRTPITALATFNELLQGSAADDNAARREFLAESQLQLARLQWITSNLLDLSRLDAGIASLSIGTHATADMMDAVAAVIRAKAAAKNVTVAIEHGDPGLGVTCDRNWMEIALSNLLANAVKFVDRGGVVTFRVLSDAAAVRFVVIDNGPGIAPEDLPKIFDRFYRGRNAGPDGAGLGLAIAQSVARAHGGRIEVQSSPGAGSVFTMEIPHSIL